MFESSLYGSEWHLSPRKCSLSVIQAHGPCFSLSNLCYICCYLSVKPYRLSFLQCAPYLTYLTTGARFHFQWFQNRALVLQCVACASRFCQWSCLLLKFRVTAPHCKRLCLSWLCVAYHCSIIVGAAARSQQAQVCHWTVVVASPRPYTHTLVHTPTCHTSIFQRIKI